MATKTYLLNDVVSLNRNFYEGYDENFFYYKAATLFRIGSNSDSFFDDVFGDKNPEGLDKKKYKEVMFAEIHFTELLQFEAFFALLVAIYQDLPHWLYLTQYHTKEIKLKVTRYLENDFSGITNNSTNMKGIFFENSIYSSYIANKDKYEKPWSENIENIDWLIKRMAKKYIEGVELNSYKHGLRVQTGKTALQIKPSNEADGDGLVFGSDNSLVFLETRRKSPGEFTVHQTTKHFSPLEAINNIHVMRLILKTMVSTRLARFKNKEGANVNTFFDIDRNSFIKCREATKWSFSV